MAKPAANNSTGFDHFLCIQKDTKDTPTIKMTVSTPNTTTLLFTMLYPPKLYEVTLILS